ncbi:MAG TPA: hypothetical protein VIG06_30780 [Kofleriaceae bacterium]|jgi:hypothetical protein
MTKKSKDANRRLGLRRETVRRLTALDPADLAVVAGGWKSSTCPNQNSADTFGKTTYLC